MRFMHLSDLHLGKRVNEFSMLEDQSFILKQILDIADAELPDAVIIAGDIYDKSIPPAEAVQLFDDFLCALAQRKLQVFVLSGNHDSPERLAFGARLMNLSGIHISPVYDGTVLPTVLKDDYGIVNIYMLPFIKPAHVHHCYQDESIVSYTDAVSTAIRHMNVDPTSRNVLVTHQFVTGAQRSDSEYVSVGGSDNVNASVFDFFDYVALGHLHGPQHIERESIRYCGTPLKYSFSEVNHQKSVTIVEMAEKGELAIRTIPLTPLHDLREIRGTYMELTDRSNYVGTATDDYLHITLTDEQDVPDAIGRLRIVYPNLMKLDYDNLRTRNGTKLNLSDNLKKKSPLELFKELYEKQNGQAMSQEQLDFSTDLMKRIWEEI